MKVKNPNIFPTHQKIGDVSQSEGGLTLRDYFAAKAMQSIAFELLSEGRETTENPDFVIRMICTISYDIADAMLKRRAE